MFIFEKNPKNIKKTVEYSPTYGTVEYFNFVSQVMKNRIVYVSLLKMVYVFLIILDKVNKYDLHTVP